MAHGWLAAELCLGFTRVEPKRELGQLAENPPAYQKKRLKASQRGGRRSHRKSCVCQRREKLSTASGGQEKGAMRSEKILVTLASVSGVIRVESGSWRSQGTWDAGRRRQPVQAGLSSDFPSMSG